MYSIRHLGIVIRNCRLQPRDFTIQQNNWLPKSDNSLDCMELLMLQYISSIVLLHFHKSPWSVLHGQMARAIYSWTINGECQHSPIGGVSLDDIDIIPAWQKWIGI